MPIASIRSGSVLPFVFASSARIAWNAYSHGFFTDEAFACAL